MRDGALLGSFAQLYTRVEEPRSRGAEGSWPAQRVLETSALTMTISDPSANNNAVYGPNAS